MKRFELWVLLLSCLFAGCFPGCQSSKKQQKPDSVHRADNTSRDSDSRSDPKGECGSDSDCQTYFRCIDSHCRKPPAMTGQQKSDTPQAAIYRSEEETEPIATYWLEVADTPRERNRGLMYRPSIKEDWGMVFIFPGQSIRQFWMKNTLIPLDMLFIEASGEIVNIVHSAEPKTRRLRESEAPVKYVLELKGGEAKKNDIEAGHRVDFEGLD